MQLSNFDYSLPRELIAQYPLKQRDSARLLILDRNKNAITHCVFSDIRNYFSKEDLLILNDTKVVPCRLIGRRKTGAKVEIFLLRPHNGTIFDAMIHPARVKIGEEIILNSGLSARVTAHNQVLFQGISAEEVYMHGQIPLPPYIKRSPQDLDTYYYQTVYAKESGAVASPTAGLHFTEQLIQDLLNSGTRIGYVTLHVGPGTFKPVKTEDIAKHKMEHEYFKVSNETAGLIEDAHKNNKRICAVGTTSCRVLETLASGKKEGETDLFIYPGYKFAMTDCLLTNFHLPRTTLFMLVCAFCGENLAKLAYQEAVRKQYRFYSYGDAMLIL